MAISILVGASTMTGLIAGWTLRWWIMRRREFTRDDCFQILGALNHQWGTQYLSKGLQAKMLRIARSLGE
jgi:hypothetical protein